MPNIAESMINGAQGWLNPCMIFASGGSSAKNAANNLSGGITAQLLLQTGATYYTTLLNLGITNSLGNNAGTAIPRFVNTENASALVCRAWKIGTASLNATGNRMVHDAATFPILGKQMGNNNEPLGLIPLMLVESNASATAAQFYVRGNNVSGNGYVNQDGSNVQGSVLFTMPAATVVRYSGYILRLNQGDFHVRDITGIDVTAATTGGNVSFWGLEVLGATYSPYTGAPHGVDQLFNGGWWPLLAPLPLATANNAVVTEGIVITATGNLSTRGIFMSACNKVI